MFKKIRFNLARHKVSFKKTIMFQTHYQQIMIFNTKKIYYLKPMNSTLKLDCHLIIMKSIL